MKIKDLKVGMSVALKASAYSPHSAPARAVVVSLDHVPLNYLGVRREEDVITLSAIDEHTGSPISVRTRGRKRTLGDGPPRVALAYPAKPGAIGLEPTFVPPARIEGPWAEVAAQRAEWRDKSARAREDAEAASRATRAALEAVSARLSAHGVEHRPYPENGRVVLTTAQATALADLLDRQG